MNDFQVSSDDYRQKINGEWMHFYQVTVSEVDHRDKVFVFDNQGKAKEFEKGVIASRGV